MDKSIHYLFIDHLLGIRHKEVRTNKPHPSPHWGFLSDEGNKPIHKKGKTLSYKL